MIVLMKMRMMIRKKKKKLTLLGLLQMIQTKMTTEWILIMTAMTVIKVHNKKFIPRPPFIGPNLLSSVCKCSFCTFEV